MRPRFGVVVRHALHAAVHDGGHLWKRQAALSNARGKDHLALPLIVAVVLLSKNARALSLCLVPVKVMHIHDLVHLRQLPFHYLMQLVDFGDSRTEDEQVALGVAERLLGASNSHFAPIYRQVGDLPLR